MYYGSETVDSWDPIYKTSYDHHTLRFVLELSCDNVKT